jgi:hypothetical protein
MASSRDANDGRLPVTDILGSFLAGFVYAFILALAWRALGLPTPRW